MSDTVRMKIYPVGTTTFFDTIRDELGNEEYVGATVVTPPVRNPDPNYFPPQDNIERVPIQVNPTYGSEPIPSRTSPVDPSIGNPNVAGAPGDRGMSVTVVEEINVSSGDARLRTSEPYFASQVSGATWSNPWGAISADGQSASTDASLNGDLVLSGFSFNIPREATITGLQVTVKRRLL